ncbi:DUF2524 family protein [Halalkalibacter urbisdiaboli]|uniref:DUF2524 family protein n=1 Tax=Halalkalibacter urbisdiaboli TaxID=1960589 RepID=UPI000B44F67E|nr:DUF2524 family protein [Halalkalibacter urbisdiaboli]
MEEINPLLEKVEETIERALNELMEVKIIRENDPTEFALAQKELEEREEEILGLLSQASAEEKEALSNALERVKGVQKTMVRGI